MRRRLYLWLLRLHPRRFRERYGQEMLWIFDESEHRTELLGDAAASVLRQWAFRSDLQSEPAPEGAPFFQFVDDTHPRPAVLAQGALFSMAIFLGLALLIPYGGRRVTLAAGRAWDAAWARVSASASASPAPMLFRETAEQRPIALELGALDADADRVVTAQEIAAAPAALSSPHTVEAPPSEAIRINLLHVLLDTDRDGSVSLLEIARAPAALRAADTNSDGQLDWAEMVPEAVSWKLSVLLGADRDGDRKVSREESQPNFPYGLFGRADRNRDGFVTGEELLAELR